MLIAIPSGKLAADPTIVTSQSWPITEFTLAVESPGDKSPDKKFINYVKVSVHGKKAEAAAKLRKDDYVIVTGELSARCYLDKEQQPRAQLQIKSANNIEALSRGHAPKAQEPPDADGLPF